MTPEQMVSVPREPTAAMLAAYHGALRTYIDQLPRDRRMVMKSKTGGYRVPADIKARIRWAAMIAARPSVADKSGAPCHADVLGEIANAEPAA